MASDKYLSTTKKFKTFVESLNEQQKEYVECLIGEINTDEYHFDFLEILQSGVGNA